MGIYIKDKKYIKAIEAILKSAGVKEASISESEIDKYPLTTSEESEWYKILKEYEVLDWLEERLDRLEIGKWYKLKEAGNCIGKYAGNKRGVGFYTTGDWTDDLFMTTTSGWIEATTQEVEHMLKKEISRRYTVNDLENIDTWYHPCIWDWYYNPNIDTLATRAEYEGGEKIYSRGVWKKTSCTSVNGFKVKVNDDESLTVGCTTIPKELHITQLFDVIRRVFDEDFNKSEIEKIEDFYKNEIN